MLRVLQLLAAAALLAGCAAPEPPAPTTPGAPGLLAWDAHGRPVDAAGMPRVQVALWDTRADGFRGEPSVAVDGAGALYATAWDRVLRSADGGATWTTVFEVAPLGGLVLPGVTSASDPLLWRDAAEDRLYFSHLRRLCTGLWWTQGDGAEWRGHENACHSRVVDFQKLAGGPPGPEANPLAAGAGTVLHLCHSKGATTHCAASYDRGGTWPVERVVAQAASDGCGGPAGVPAVSGDGTVVVPLAYGCDRPLLAVSRDSGLSWRIVPGPDGVGAEGLSPEAAFDADGVLHLLWQGRDHLPYLAVARDLGGAWEGPWRASPPGVLSTEFAALGVGGGFARMAFLGTRDASDAPAQAPDAARWDLYVAVADLRPGSAPRFAAVQATPDPVQIGCTNRPGSALDVEDDPCQNLGDYIDAAMGPDGAFHVAFADGCIDACASDPSPAPAQSRATRTAGATARLAVGG